jgi:hypothetical protein
MLRSLLTLLGAAVLTFAVVGWFLGWYQIKTTPGADGHRQVNIDFNGPKIAEDVSKGTSKITNLLEKHGSQGGSAAPAPPIPDVLPLPPGSSQGGGQGVQPASATVIVRPSAPIPQSLPVPGQSWTYPKE